MQIAKVLGTVTSTLKAPTLGHSKLLLIQYVDAQGQLTANYEVASDVVGAGESEWVLVTRGSSARQESGHQNRSVDAMIVGIIDRVTVGNRPLYSKRQQEYRI